MESEKQTHILDCAARFFARFGFRKTSVAEIAREAGVAKGTIYLAADSKRDLFYQVLSREIREGVAYGAKLIDPRRDADALLPGVVGADLEYFDDSPLVRQLLVGHAAQALPEETALFHELRRSARSNIREVIALGQRQGVFRPEVDVERTAELIQDIEVSTLLFYPDEPGIGQLDHPRWATTLDIFTRGLRVTPA